MAKKTMETADYLREYGFSIEDPEGGLVRMKGGIPKDRWIAVEGGWQHYRMELGEDGQMVWKPVVYQILNTGQKDELGQPVLEGVWVWPEEKVNTVYKTAVEERQARAAESEAAG